MIIFENVYKWLEGREVLKGLDFHVQHGETFVIVGPTGTGKTVTLRHIAGLLFPNAGRILIKGNDIAQLSAMKLAEMRRILGFVFQSGALINWLSVADNVSLPLKERKNLNFPREKILEKVSETLELLEMEGTENLMPESLSGGMKKRVAIARAIITEPEILLYDEPTSGLDPIMSRKIDALIKSLKEKLKITSLVVTHDLVSAFGIADRIAMIFDGKIIECAPPEEFRKSSDSYVRQFIKAQLDISQNGKI